MSDQRVWFLSEVFYPETEGVAYFATRITAGLAKEFDVRVLCSQPSYSLRGMRCPSKETYENVTIYRCSSTRFERHSVLNRICNMSTLSFTMFFSLLWRLRAGDCVIAATNPPVLPFLAAIACRLRRAKCVICMNDVYPDLPIAAGMVKGTLVCRMMRWMAKTLWRHVDGLKVMGRDMESLVRSRLGGKDVAIHLIPVFASTDEIFPAPRTENAILKENRLLDNFVVLIAGNVGPVHNAEALMEAARLLEDTPKVRFLIIGSGKKLPWIKQTIEEEQRKNIVVLPRMPRSESPSIMNACDIAVSALFIPGMYGVADPSRTYAIMAAGKPMIAMADDGTEVALLLEEENIGWRVRPDDAEGMAKAIRNACKCPAGLNEMGERARHIAERKYSVDQIVSKYISMVRSYSNE